MQTRKGQSIEDEIMQIIENEIGSHSYNEQEWPIVRRIIHSTADFDFARDNKIIFQKNSTSTGLKTEHDMIEFLVPDDVTGPIILQFENLGGNDLADAVLPVVVNRISIDELSIPAWIKNNAGWWADDLIDDSAFLQGIQYLIKVGIIIV